MQLSLLAHERGSYGTFCRPDLEPLDGRYEIHAWRHADTILKADFPTEWAEILGVLGGFRLRRDQILERGGRKSSIASALDSQLAAIGWQEKAFDTRFQVDGVTLESPTHSVDCYKNRVALEIEWNNKDPFFDRDLNNFRLLFELRVISVGVIVTRASELQDLFDGLGKGDSYGASTTHLGKLLPRIEGGGGGGCPLLVFGIRKAAYEPGD